MTSSSAISFFIAVPGDDQESGIYGIGLDHGAAVADAYKQANHPEPSVGQDDEGEWVVHTYHDGAYEAFRTETEARDYAAEQGFIARECTERLYRYVEKYGCDASTFRWTRTPTGMDDLDVDQSLVDQALAEVRAGFEGTSSPPDVTAETVLQDAHDYVDAYVTDDEAVDEELREAIDNDPQLRIAIDVAVKEILMDELAEREAA